MHWQAFVNHRDAMFEASFRLKRPAMFPQSFTARVSQRMAIWGAMLGFLILLLALTEAIQDWRSARILVERQQATAAALSHFKDAIASDQAHAERGKELITAIESVDARQSDFKANHRQNKILVVLLTLFVVGQILVLEYRLLIKPVMHIAAVLRAGDGSRDKLADYTRRHDEIGAFAQALSSHFALVAEQQEMASAEQARLSGRLERQDELRRESIEFQDRMAEVVRQLEEHAGRMSSASENLAAVSSDADSRAAASAQSTARVSAHIDVVASSIRDIAATLSSSAEDAEETSAVATAARQAVEAAKDDARALTESARTIEQVIALIEDVAGQTNLLALNATIEAARAGEMGRGFGVVAQEVKQLATRTSRATEDVRGGLQGITAASQRIAERVAKLVQSIDQVSIVAEGIAGSMRKQDANSQAITSTTASTAKDVREVAAAVSDVAGMIGRTRQAADLVTRVSTDLGQQASALRSAVERFIETTQRIAA
jgi:methyl-accepting chemotaxis protein